MKNYKKTEHFEPIAMKCTQEQFESIKPILERFGLEINRMSNYNIAVFLVNNYSGETNSITNLTTNEHKCHNRKVYETFNAETFLKACGIVSGPLYQLTAKEMRYGAENPQWFKDQFKECFETELEVLKKEAEKRYKLGCVIKPIKGYYYGMNNNFTMLKDGFFVDKTNPNTDNLCFKSNGYNTCIYLNGVWAEILPTYTIPEAESKFNIKIV